jgi:hypothetical protein
MACTINLYSTVQWALPLFRFSPQTTGSLEPMLTSANMVKQMILGAPFSWPWNRSSVAFQTSPGQQDYPVAVYDFGYMEKVTFRDSYGDRFESEQQPALGDAAEQNRPAAVSVQNDDNAGNMVFRCMPVPDQAYSANVIYQRKSMLMTSQASLWGPIPDELNYLVNFGYVTFMAMFLDDARFQLFSQRFIAHLLSAQDSISDISRNLFLANWTQVQSQAQRIQQTTSQGIQARGV